MSHTVMVTGADGFIGSHLAEELVKSGEKVRAFCLYNSFGSLGWIDTLPPEIRNEMDIFMGDVRDLSLIHIFCTFISAPPAVQPHFFILSENSQPVSYTHLPYSRTAFSALRLAAISSAICSCVARYPAVSLLCGASVRKRSSIS